MSEAQIRSQYNQQAAIYDRLWRSYTTKTLTFLQNWAQIKPEAIVLDIGCGTGEFEKLLLQTNPSQSIVGVDLSEKMLDIAREKCQTYDKVDFRVASADFLPFEDNSFDLVVSASAFHYFNQPLAALAQIKRVLKPDGAVVILDWNKDYFVCRIYDWILQLFDPAHQQCYTQTELDQLLTTAQFQVQRTTTFRVGLVWELMILMATRNLATEASCQIQ